MVRLWWPQPARPPPQRWRQMAEHREAPRGVTPPQPDTTWWWHDSGGGSVVEKGKGCSGCRMVVRWWQRNGEDGDVMYNFLGCDCCMSVWKAEVAEKMTPATMRGRTR
ncbi:hypothetical protein Tco_0420600 [Tanacetum coccineum]